MGLVNYSFNQYIENEVWNNIGNQQSTPNQHDRTSKDLIPSNSKTITLSRKVFAIQFWNGSTYLGHFTDLPPSNTYWNVNKLGDINFPITIPSGATHIGLSNIAETEPEENRLSFADFQTVTVSYTTTPERGILKGRRNYLLFDGVNDYTFTNDSLFDLYSSNTTKEVEVDFSLKSYNSNDNQYIMYANSTNNVRTYIYISTNNEISIYLGETVLNTNVIPNLNQIYNVRVVHNNTNVTVYIDDNVVINNQSWTIGTFSNRGITLGNTYNGTSWANISLYYYKITNNGTTFLEYDFSEGSGTTLNDISGNNRDSTIYGATWGEEGAPLSAIYKGSPSYALSFDGVDDYASFSLHSTVIDNFEIEIDITINGLPNENYVFYSNGYGNGYQLFHWETQPNKLTIHAPNVFLATAQETTLTIGQSYNVKFGRNSGTYFMTVNGVSQTLVQTGGTIGNAFTPTTGSYFNYSITVSERYIGQYNVSYLSFKESGTLVHEYDFTEGSGNTLTDKVGNNNGTINGATWFTVYDNEIQRVYKGDDIVYGGDIYNLIGDVLVTSNTTQIDFDNLNITKDDELLLVSTIETDAGHGFKLYVNNNTTDGNYYYQYLYADGSNISANRSTIPYFTLGRANPTTTYTNIKLSNNDKYVFQSNSLMDGGSGASSIEQINFNVVSTFTLTTITKLSIVAGATDKLFAGSRLTLYKLNRGEA